MEDEIYTDMEDAWRFGPRWELGWTREEAEEIVELAKSQKVELNDKFAVAIEMTRQYDEASVDVVDSETSEESYLSLQ